ncbi:MAG: ATP-binding protein [Candidatus Micrarchaeota archaeon]
MTYTDLLRFNPWWENSNAINNDCDILNFSKERIKYLPELRLRAGINIVRGPRQVGKTTLLKLKIKELLNKTDPKRIFYYSFELLRKPEDINNIILEYLDSVAVGDVRYIFLDETTTILEWTRGIKLLIDRGDIKKEDFVFVTGSSSMDLKKGAERLPGRGIEGNEYYYLPCSFRTYLALKGIKLPSIRITNSKLFFEEAKNHMPKILTLNRELFSYIQTGGFLYSMNHGKNELTLERYARWLEGDFIKWGKNPLVVKEILQSVIKKSCSQFSYHSISKETSVQTHNTIIDYSEMLGYELFLRVVNKASLPFKVERRKEKKAFFIDPLLMAIAERWTEQRLPEACKIEQIVMSHLSRFGNLYFYNDGKKEIDCIFKISNKVVSVEVKWSDNICQYDSYAVKKTDVFYIVSKGILKKENEVPVIPTSLFLAMLDIKEFVKRNVLSPS